MRRRSWRRRRRCRRGTPTLRTEHRQPLVHPDEGQVADRGRRRYRSPPWPCSATRDPHACRSFRAPGLPSENSLARVTTCTIATSSGSGEAASTQKPDHDRHAGISSAGADAEARAAASGSGTTASAIVRPFTASRCSRRTPCALGIVRVERAPHDRGLLVVEQRAHADAEEHQHRQPAQQRFAPRPASGPPSTEPPIALLAAARSRCALAPHRPRPQLAGCTPGTRTGTRPRPASGWPRRCARRACA